MKSQLFTASVSLFLVSCSAYTNFTEVPGTIGTELPRTDNSLPKEVAPTRPFLPTHHSIDVELIPRTGASSKVVFITDNSGSMLPYQTKLASALDSLLQNPPSAQVSIEAYSSTLLAPSFPSVNALNGENLWLPSSPMKFSAGGGSGAYTVGANLFDNGVNPPLVDITFLKNKSLFATSDGKLNLAPQMSSSELSQAKLKLRNGILAGNNGNSNEEAICVLLKLVHEEGPNAPFQKDQAALVVLTTDTNPFEKGRNYNCPKSMKVNFNHYTGGKRFGYKYYSQIISQKATYACGDQLSSTCVGDTHIYRRNCGEPGVCDDISELNKSRSCSNAEEALLLNHLESVNAGLPVGKKTELYPGSLCSSRLIELSNPSNSALTFSSNAVTCASLPLGGGFVPFEQYAEATWPTTRIVSGSCIDQTPKYANKSMDIEYYPGLSANSTGSEIVQRVRAKLSETSGAKGFAIMAIANLAEVNPMGVSGTEQESVLVKELLGNDFSLETFYSVFNPDFSSIEQKLKRFIEWEMKLAYDLPANFPLGDSQKITLVFNDGTERELLPSEYKIVGSKLELLISNTLLQVKSIRVTSVHNGT